MTPKDFQKATADRILAVFRGGQNRVLLADEVGLGKTIVASEVIRQVSEWHRVEKNDDHFKVVYICSNINIAAQNAKKLGISDLMNVSESRLSMQHLKLYQSRGREHEYEQLIPLTPATSFSMTSGCGTQEERALMFAILKRLPEFQGRETELRDFMAYNAEKYWAWYVDYYENEVQKCDANGSRYIEEITAELQKRLDAEGALCGNILDVLNSASPQPTESRALINGLREIFAEIGLDKLEPDLVIMDEFQRFHDLIQPASGEQGKLSRRFLQNNDANVKVLLLSATPYKAYSTPAEVSEDEKTEHYREFMDVMQFLLHGDDDTKMQRFKTVWRDYSRALTELSKGDFTLLFARKNAAEEELYSSVSRTERFSSGIIDDSGACEVAITDGDILSYSAMQRVLDEINDKNSRTLHYRDVPLDYVKSSPYLLSFMEYQLKEQITDYFTKHPELGDTIKANAKYLLLKKSAIHNYQPIAANNARLQKLKKVVFDDGKNGAENLLWLPPSKPYYKTGSVFDKNKHYSKVLLFSSWAMVPRMASAMLSYEAERLTIGALYHSANTRRGRGYFAEDKRRFGTERLKGEPQDLICYVSPTLARLYDPLQHIGKDIKQIRRELAKLIQPLLDSAKKKYSLRESGGKGAKSLLAVLKFLDGATEIPPTDIPVGACDLLVNMAIGSPAICAYRLPGFDASLAEKLADKVFVRLFQKAESSAVLDLLYGGKSDDSYYENVIKYCVDGNLQSTLDEYAHILGETGTALCAAIIDAVADTTSLKIDSSESYIGMSDEKMSIRTHFAVGYFNAKVSDENVQRADKIRKAFNSPFRPFVLSTTSIGQEGLDFHYYCRKVVHWNLPSNPVDIEQREGRVNRYKCLALRQNIAERYADEPTWDAMFEAAARAEKGAQSDLVPYWCLSDRTATSVKIERIVPMYPLSQDRLKYERLIKILSFYRLTLGQPRQEELVELISKEISPNEIDSRLFIDLSPYNRLRGR
ncbi:MAG: hypothetical protein LBN30_11070 [Oscillospiraceae bacterium]|jgi:hypothetical protein|nr:hypothetical protein [Oscillospiraceae bacterium]